MIVRRDYAHKNSLSRRKQTARRLFIAVVFRGPKMMYGQIELARISCRVRKTFRDDKLIIHVQDLLVSAKYIARADGRVRTVI